MFTRILKSAWLALGLSGALVSSHAQNYSFVTNDGALSISAYAGPAPVVSIPPSTNGIPITAILSYAFNGSTTLANITIPGSITNIGTNAFDNCSALTNATLSAGVITISPGAFENCSQLRAVTLSTGLISIGSYAFAKSSLSSLTLPDSVVSVGPYSFESGLLTNVIFSSNVANLDDSAFVSNALYNITLPASLTNLGGQVFYGNQLTNIFFKGNPPACSSTSFLYNNNLSLFYLPGATGWSSTFNGPHTYLWNPTIQTQDGTFGFQNNQFGFNITGTSSIPIVIQGCTDLAHPVWVPLQALALPVGGYFFSEPATNGPWRFYRIASQ